MPAKFPVEQADRLLSRARAETLDPQQLFTLLPVRVYQEVADIGCGPGYFAVPLAKFLFNGRVVALDTQEEMLERVRQRARDTRLGNISAVLSKETKVPLDDDSVDGALLSLVLREATRPKSLLKEAHRILRRGGWAAIVELDSIKNNGLFPGDAYLPLEKAIRLARETGFRVAVQRPLGACYYFVLLTK